ncbi:hypothetical protein CMI46_03160 [Candidatus Pacearchaeota archaeon]|nr:hypothetical protein [Candidatus Pacearchaeota archaeon]|tara:strand:- start:7063 stop:7332 length:270 start_codon:yes stop_codon:yes gene_type:complete
MKSERHEKYLPRLFSASVLACSAFAPPAYAELSDTATIEVRVHLKDTTLHAEQPTLVPLTPYTLAAEFISLTALRYYAIRKKKVGKDDK